MNLEEATKRVRAEKPRENYMVIELETSYNKRLLLPHKDAVAFLEALKSAEILSDGYSEPKRIIEPPRDYVVTKAFSAQEYERYKMAALLNLTPDEVKLAQEAAANPLPNQLT